MRKITTPKKMGRPKAEKPKNESIKVRFDSELFGKLNNYCKNKDITRAEAIREGVKMLLETEKTK